jgi:hypothetical protein
MGADLHLHVLTEKFTEDHCAAFKSNVIGSRFFKPGFDREFEKRNSCDLFRLCSETPNVWIGEVSWLKAALFENSGDYIPKPVEEIHEIVDENFPVIDDELIERISNAMKYENATMYEMAKEKDVIDFLIMHKGEKIFYISW